MKISRIAELVDGRVLVDNSDDSVDVKQACSTDLMSDVLRFATKGALLITALNQSQAIRTAEIADIPAVLMVHKKIDKEIIELAQKKNIALISTHLPMFTVCGILYEGGLRSCLEER